MGWPGTPPALPLQMPSWAKAHSTIVHPQLQPRRHGIECLAIQGMSCSVAPDNGRKKWDPEHQELVQVLRAGEVGLWGGLGPLHPEPEPPTPAESIPSSPASSPATLQSPHPQAALRKGLLSAPSDQLPPFSSGPFLRLSSPFVSGAGPQGLLLQERG